MAKACVVPPVLEGNLKLNSSSFEVKHYGKHIVLVKYYFTPQMR